MIKGLIIFGIVLVICGLGLGTVIYISMREEIKRKNEWLKIYAKLVEAQEEQIIAFERLVTALKEKIQIMEEGAESEQL